MSRARLDFLAVLPVLLVVLVLLVLPGPAAAATTTDPAGDGQRQRPEPPLLPTATDILRVEGTRQDDVLELRMHLAGPLPASGEQEPERRFTYLFIVGQGGGNASLHGQSAIAATCHFHRGMLDLQCQVTQGDATARGAGVRDQDLSLRLAVPWEGDFRVGAAAHESLPNGTQRDILIQDFTANAFPSGELPTEGPGGAAPATPWWRTPWILLAVLVALVAVGWAWSTLARR